MHCWKVLIPVGMLVISGCVSQSEAQQVSANFDSCKAQGYKDSSFHRCMENLKQQQETQDQNRRDKLLLLGLATMTASQPPPQPQRRFINTNCHRYGGNISCTTY